MIQNATSHLGIFRVRISLEILMVRSMVLWIITLLLAALITAAGRAQGGIRAAFTFLGLVLGAVISLPMAGITRLLLSLCGITHPVFVDLLAPTCLLILTFLVVKGAGFFVHSKIHQFYKYKTDDGHRARWERFNQQLGLCVGAANAALAIFLIYIGIYVVGYFTVQTASQADPWWARTINAATKGMQATRFHRALSSMIPASKFYFDAADVLGLIVRSPQLQDRLSRYPAFLALAEEAPFKELGKDADFLKLWKENPPLHQLLAQKSIQPLVRDPELYERLVNLLFHDVSDLRTYLETGQSPKYSEHPITDRWTFNLGASFAHSKRLKPNRTIAERQWLRAVYQAIWSNAILIAFPDNTLLVKNKDSAGKAQSTQGEWKHAYGNKYILKIKYQGQPTEFETLLENQQLVLTHEKLALVFDP